MKLFGSLIFTAALLMPACATVEIASGDTAPVVKHAELKDSVSLRTSAKTLSYTFAENGWSHTAPHSKVQSATSVLLRGLKRDKAVIVDPVKAYTQSVTFSDVKADIAQANKMVEAISAKGYTFLSQNPDHMRVRRDLAALEKALVAARQAEMTFDAALKAKSAPLDVDDNFAASVDRLRSVTDAFGDRQRAKTTVQAAS